MLSTEKLFQVQEVKVVAKYMIRTVQVMEKSYARWQFPASIVLKRTS